MPAWTDVRPTTLTTRPIPLGPRLSAVNDVNFVYVVREQTPVVASEIMPRIVTEGTNSV